MSWLSKISGSDAKKRNVRNLDAAARLAAEAAQRGEDPSGIFMPAVQDWTRTNNRVNMQTGLKGAALVAGGSMLAGAGGAGGAGGGGIRALGAAPVTGGGAGAAPSAGGWMGGLQSVGRWALDNPELIAGGLSTLGGLDAQRKAGRNEKKMMELIEREYADRAPLRQMGLRNLTREMEPLDPSVFVNRNNPFSR